MHKIFFPPFFGPSLAIAGYKQPKQLDADLDNDDSMLCKTVVTKDRRYITQITCYEKGSEKSETETKRKQGTRPLTYGKQTNGGALASLFSFPSRSSSLTRTRNQLKQQQFLSSGTSIADTSWTVIDVIVSSTALFRTDIWEIAKISSKF